MTINKPNCYISRPSICVKGGEDWSWVTNTSTFFLPQTSDAVTASASILYNYINDTDNAVGLPYGKTLKQHAMFTQILIRYQRETLAGQLLNLISTAHRL